MHGANLLPFLARKTSSGLDQEQGYYTTSAFPGPHRSFLTIQYCVWIYSEVATIMKCPLTDYYFVLDISVYVFRKVVNFCCMISCPVLIFVMCGRLLSDCSYDFRSSNQENSNTESVDPEMWFYFNTIQYFVSA